MKSLYLLLIMGMFPVVVPAQQRSIPDAAKPTSHHEIQQDPYLPNAYNNLKTTPAMRYKSTGIITTQVNVDANGMNIVGDAANEPSITIDPTNPDHMAIGWRQFDNVASSFRQAGFGYSTDGGQHWTFPGVIDPGVFRSDPVLDVNAEGTFFYNSLNSVGNYFTCKVFKSSDGGASWDAGVDARGGDKQWMTVDRSGGLGDGNIHSFWTTYWSSCIPASFSRSTDGGASFEDCEEIDGNPYWGTMAVGNDGELYICGTGNFGGPIVVKSSTAWNSALPVAFDFWEPVNLDGYLVSQVSVNPVGLLGQMNIDVDRSDGPGRGNVYALASVVRYSNGDSADVMFARSEDGGHTWSNPVRVNDDTGIEFFQWFGTMSVAPNGRIDAAWLDSRDGFQYDYPSSLYYAYSLDEGVTWSANVRLSDAFDPHIGWPVQQKMGDYFDMESDNDGVHLAWANTLNGEQDVYYSYITPDITGIQYGSGTFNRLTLSVYPNPFREKSTIRYSIPADGHVKLVIFDLWGKEVAILEEGFQTSGPHRTQCSLDLPAGYYECRLTAGGYSRHTGLIRIH